MRYFLVLAFFVIAGCSQVQKLGKTSCSDSDGTALVTKLLKDQSVKMLEQEKNSEGGRLFDGPSIRAQLASIQIAITDIRTDKIDPNSSKVFCKANVKVTLPADALANADEALRSLEQGDLTALAGRSDMERSANVFASEIEYTLQPTDDRESIYAEAPESHGASEFIRWVAGAQLVASIRQAATVTKSIAESIPQVVAGPESEILAEDAADQQVQVAEPAIEASFSCSGASTPIEKAICSDAELAGLDRDVGRLFQYALRAYPDSDVRGLQVSWLNDERNTCDSLQCLFEEYRDRKDYFATNFPGRDEE